MDFPPGRLESRRFSELLCNFEVTLARLQKHGFVTGEKQRKRTEAKWVMMASGLHMWTQLSPN